MTRYIYIYIYKERERERKYRNRSDHKVIHDTQSAPQISQKQDEHNIYVIMKTMCSPSYHHNDFVATHALKHMIYVYTLLVPMNQRVLNKLSKEHNRSGHKRPTTHRVLKSHRSNMSIIYMLS